MNNILSIDEFLNESEGEPIPFLLPDILFQRNHVEVFAWYVDTLPTSTQEEKAIAGEIFSFIGDPDEREFLEDDWAQDGENEQGMLLNIINHIDDEAQDGRYEDPDLVDEEEFMFSEDDFEEFITKYIAVPFKTGKPVLIFNLKPLGPDGFIAKATERNPEFTDMFLGQKALDQLRKNLINGVPFCYSKLLPLVEEWKPGSVEEITEGIEGERIKSLDKAYKLLQRK